MKTILRTALAAAALISLAACATVPEIRSTQAESRNMETVHTAISRYSFAETVNRLKKAFEDKGMTVFAVIDHQAAAAKDGLKMQPAAVLVYGTPKAGTPLMVKDPAFALELPLKVLVTETGGRVQVVFRDTRSLIADSKIEYAEVENTLANAEKLIRKIVTE